MVKFEEAVDVIPGGERDDDNIDHDLEQGISSRNTKVFFGFVRRVGSKECTTSVIVPFSIESVKL